MSDMNQDINILIDLQLNKSQSAINNLENQLKEVEKLLNEKGIMLNIGIDPTSLTKIKKVTKDIADGAKNAGEQLGKGIKGSIEDLQKFQKLLNNVEKGLQNLESKKQGIIKDHERAFNQSNKNSMFNQVVKQGGIKRPQKGEQGYDWYTSLDENLKKNSKLFKPQKSDASNLDKVAQNFNVSKQDIMNTISKGVPKFDPASVPSSAFGDLNKKEGQLKSLQNTYNSAIEKEKVYIDVINQQTKAVRENIISEKARQAEAIKTAQAMEQEAKRRRKATFDNLNDIKANNKLAKLQVVTDPDGTRRAMRLTYKDEVNRTQATVHTDGNGKPHTIVRESNKEALQKDKDKLDFFRQDNTRKINGLSDYNGIIDGDKISKVDQLLNNLNLKNFKKDSVEVKQLIDDLNKELTQAYKTAGSINIDRDKLKNQASKMIINGKIGEKEAEDFYNRVIGANSVDKVKVLQRELDKLRLTSLQISKNDKLDKLFDNAKDSADRKLVSMATTGKIGQSDFDKYDALIKEADETKKLIELKKELNRVERDTKLAGAFSGDNVGKIDLSKNTIASLTSNDLVRALKETNSELRTMKILEAEVNRTTGEWSVTVKDIHGQTRRMSGAIDQVTGEIKRQTDAIKQNNAANKTMIELFATAARRFPVWMAVTTAFYGVTRGLQDMVSTIIQVDSQMTQLKRVMNEKTNFEAMLDSSIKMAKELGQTVTDVNEAMIGFAKAGFNQQQVLDLTKAAIVASNVSDLSVAESMDTMTSAMVQFGIEADKAMSIVDKMNEVDNNFAISTKDIAEGISRAGATAETFGVTIDELIGNITAIGSATRESGAVIGNSLKTIYSRLTSNDSTTALEQVGVMTQDINGENKRASVILDDLSKQWNTLTASQQQNIGVVVAGRYQLSRFLAMMNNWHKSEEATATALQSSGSAMRENEKYQKSLEARINRLKSSWQELSLTIGDSVLTDSLVGAMKAAEGMLTFFNNQIGQIGLLPPLLLAVGLALGIYRQRLLAATAAMNGANVATGFFAKNLGTLKWAITGVSVGLRSLMAASLVGIVFMGIGIGVDYLLKKFADYNEESKKFNELNGEKVRQLDEQRNSLKTMSTEYEKLKLNTNRTAEEEKRLVEIQKELVKAYGVAATGLDASGNLYSDNIDLINKRVEALNEEIKAEQNLNRIKLTAKDPKIRKNIEDTRKVREEDFKQLKKLEEQKYKLNDVINGNATLDNTDRGLGSRMGLIDKLKGRNEPSQGQKDAAKIQLGAVDIDIVKIKKGIDEDSAEIQKYIDERAVYFTGFSEQKMREIDLTVKDKSKRLGDSQRYFVTEISKALSGDTGNIDIQNIESQLSDFISKTNDSQLQGLLAGYEKAIKKFKDVPTEEAKQSVENLKKDIFKEIDELVKGLETKSPEAAAALKKVADQFKDGLNIDTSKLSKLNLGLDFEAITKQANEMKNSLAPLNEALLSISKGEELTAEEAMNLMSTYTELAGKIHQTANGWTVEKGALEDVRKARIDLYTETLRTQTHTTTAVTNEVAKRLKQYGIEFASITSLKEATRAYGEMDAYLKSDRGGAFSYYASASPEETKKLTETFNLTKELADGFALFDSAISAVSDKTYGLSKSSLKPEKAKKEVQDIKQFVIDEYANAISNLDDKIHESELSLGNFTTTSQAYRDELKSQIELLKEKQNIAHLHADVLRAENSELEKQTKGMGNFNNLSEDGKSKYNELSKAINDNNTAIRGLSSSWLDWETTIQSKHFDTISSNIDNMSKSLEDLDSRINRSKAIMGTLDEGSPEYKRQVEEQIALYKQMQQETHKVADQIRSDLSSGGLNDKDKEALQKRLDSLSDSWWDYENSIVQAHKSLKKQAEDIADKMVELYKDMYKEQKKLAIEAISEQDKLLDKNHQKEMDRIDEEGKAYEKSVQDQIKGIDKVSNERKYSQDLNKKLSDREKLQTELDRISLSSDSADKKRARDLAEQIANSDLDIENIKQDHKDQFLKDELQTLLDDYKTKQELAKENAKFEVIIDGQKHKDKYDVLKEFLDKEKTATEKHFDGLIDDEIKYEKMRKEIISGTFDITKKEFTDLKTFLEKNGDLLGKSIQKSLIDRFTTIIDQLKMIRSESQIIDDMQKRSTGWFSATPEQQKQLEQDNMTDGALVGAHKDPTTGEWIGSNGKPLYPSNNSGGGSGGSTGGGGNTGSGSQYYQPVGSEEGTIKQMMKNSNEYNSTSDSERKKQLETANETMGLSIQAVKKYGTWYKNNLPLYHDGGVVGKSGSKFANIINQLFNTKNNEQALKATIGEVMIPEKNIASNFIPSMGKFAQMASGNSGDTIHNYNLNVQIDKVQGNEDGGKKLVSTLIKGVKKLGGKS